MCVFSSGLIFECHWNLISQRHKAKGEVSQEQLPNNAELDWLRCRVCRYPNEHVVRVKLQLCNWFNAAARFLFFNSLGCVFYFLFSRMTWQQDKCTELWRTNRVNCPSQNARPIICKTSEKKAPKKWESRNKKKMCYRRMAVNRNYVFGFADELAEDKIVNGHKGL